VAGVGDDVVEVDDDDVDGFEVLGAAIDWFDGDDCKTDDDGVAARVGEL
jgi:hypothetical protein